MRGRSGRCGAAAAFATLALLSATAASANAATLETVEVPTRHVEPATANWAKPGHPPKLLANVLLPDGYDGERRFPLLLLLHGASGRWDSWADPSLGDVMDVARGLDAIVVMPDAAVGFYSNWWNGGRRQGPAWERFFLEELIPFVEERYPILPGRANHAVAGLSMGGYGAAFLATQAPGYFGSVAAFSGLLDIQSPEVAPLLTVGSGSDVVYETYWGPPEEFYATGHNPTRLTENLAASRVFVSSGDGLPEPGVPVEPNPDPVTDSSVEVVVRPQNDRFAEAARRSGADVTYTPHHGLHEWGYWRRDLRAAIDWGLFRPLPERPERWRYRTVARQGEMWGLRFEFAEPPNDLATFTRSGATLNGDGGGSVTIVDEGGCTFTEELPFTRELAGRPCRRLRLRASPALIAGRRIRVRLTVTGEGAPVEGATVRLAGRRAVTDEHGRASLVVTASRPPRATAVKNGWLRGTARLGLTTHRPRALGSRP